MLALSCTTDLTADSVEDSGSIKTLSSDLQIFASNQESLFIGSKTPLVTRSAGTTNAVQIDEDLLNKMDEELKKFLDEHDIFYDLTESQKDGLHVDPEYAKMMLLDHDLYIEYIKNHKSEEFCAIVKELIDKNTIGMSQDEIINDEELYLNEKINLLLVLPAINSSKYASTRNLSTKSTTANLPRKTSSNESTSKQQKCLDEYESAKKKCLAEYLISCGLSTIGANPISTSIGIGWATYQYYECEDTAHDAYINCLK